jgi:glutaminyl-tRNA synthetase
LFDRLFTVENPLTDENLIDFINPDSLVILKACRVEHWLKNAVPGELFQFERKGYFCVDEDSSLDNLTFNRTISLRDTWARIRGKK